MSRNSLAGIILCTALVIGLVVHFTPSIYVTQGDTITMMLSSSDSYLHQFLVDFDGDGGESMDCPSVDPCSATFHTSTAIPYTFTVGPTIQPGTYHYICVIHYPYMVGQFVVQPPGPDFGVASNPSSVSILQGSNSNSTITVSSINNFAGTITLSASPSASGPMTNFSTNPL